LNFQAWSVFLAPSLVYPRCFQQLSFLKVIALWIYMFKDIYPYIP